MRKFYTTILVMVVAVVMWSGVAVAGQAGQKGRRYRPMVMTEDRVERMLSRIRQIDPEKAEQLASLQEKDPNDFQKQLREYFRQELGERNWGQKGQSRSGRGSREGHQMMMPGRGRMDQGPMGERMLKDHIDFMSWLTENYPDKAQRLQKLQQEGDMEAYFGQLGSIMRTYKPIMKASKRNPELAGVLKEDLSLKKQRRELLEEIKMVTDEGEKKQLKNQLEKVVADRFELIIKRKQMQYEELLQKIERLKEQVRERKNEVDSLKSQKADKVKERLEELLSGTEKVDWD
jgi:hypothetical protein